jgi:hypothetical protein
MSRSLPRALASASTLLIASSLLLSSSGAHALPRFARELLPTSAADLTPPPIAVLTSEPSAARGLVFVAPKSRAEGAVTGPEIIDDQGRPVWFHALTNGDNATDFKVQRYRGEPVITWSQSQGSQAQGQPNGGQSPTPTVDYIVDQSYRVVATVQAGNGLNADSHEFKISERNTALITIYNRIPYDLSSVGGPADGSVVDGVVQEIDIASGDVLFEWHSVDHVALGESHAPLPAAGNAYDYFHINAVSVDTDDNFVISARNTWALYKLDRRTGDVLWRLGGKQSDFELGDGVEFAWQHDPEPVGFGTYRLFDNEASPQVREHSRVIWIHADQRRHTATLVQAFEHPDGILAGSQGNSQALPWGHTFVGWGATGRFSEFSPRGELLFDAQVPAGYDDYRAYRAEWHGKPLTKPTASVTHDEDGTPRVHAIWNGATEVARWYVIGGADSRRLWPLASGAWDGLDTAIAIGGAPNYVAVVAQDARGRIIGRSEPIALAQ